MASPPAKTSLTDAVNAVPMKTPLYKGAFRCWLRWPQSRQRAARDHGGGKRTFATFGSKVRFTANVLAVRTYERFVNGLADQMLVSIEPDR